MSNKHKQTVLDLDQKITALVPHGVIKGDDDDWRCTVTMIFFSFWITRTSANTDVLGRALEVRVNEVLHHVAHL